MVLQLEVAVSALVTFACIFAYVNYMQNMGHANKQNITNLDTTAILMRVKRDSDTIAQNVTNNEESPITNKNNFLNDKNVAGIEQSLVTNNEHFHNDTVVTGIEKVLITNKLFGDKNDSFALNGHTTEHRLEATFSQNTNNENSSEMTLITSDHTITKITPISENSKRAAKENSMTNTSEGNFVLTNNSEMLSNNETTEKKPIATPSVMLHSASTTAKTMVGNKNESIRINNSDDKNTKVIDKQTTMDYSKSESHYTTKSNTNEDVSSKQTSTSVDYSKEFRINEGYANTSTTYIAIDTNETREIKPSPTVAVADKEGESTTDNKENVISILNKPTNYGTDNNLFDESQLNTDNTIRTLTQSMNYEIKTIGKVDTLNKTARITALNENLELKNNYFTSSPDVTNLTQEDTTPDKWNITQSYRYKTKNQLLILPMRFNTNTSDEEVHAKLSMSQIDSLLNARNNVLNVYKRRLALQRYKYFIQSFYNVLQVYLQKSSKQLNKTTDYKDKNPFNIIIPNQNKTQRITFSEINI